MPPRPADLDEAGALIFQALADLARDRPDLRSALQVLADAAGPEKPKARSDTEGSSSTLAEKILTPRPGPSREESAIRPARKVELSVVVRRARWKAAACRLAIEKRGVDDEEVRQQEENLRGQRNSLEDCWAWMLDETRALPEDQLLKDVAQCYDTLALAAETALNLQGAGMLEPKPPAELLYLLAEAQSGLLSGLHKCDLRGDSDQRDLFLWLKDQTTLHRIYVDRHMRLDDPADSTGAADLAERLDALFERFTQHAERGKARTKFLNKVRYHLGKVGGAEVPSDADLTGVEAACAEWLEAGLPPDDAELGDMVKQVTSGASLTGRATSLVLDASCGAQEDRPPRDVLGECQALLEGSHALFLGSEEQAARVAQLDGELGLSGTRFVPLDLEDDALARAEQELGKKESDIVLIAYRLPAEDYSAFKELCMQLECPFVRLPGEVSGTHVAQQVLRQVGWRLRQATSGA